jgi:hypothetical protein
MTATKQNMIAVSTTVKTFVKDCTADFGGPSKSKDFLAASEREILDAMTAFVEANRYQVREVEETNEEGETALVSVEVDTFGEAVNQVISDRMDSVRVNTAAAKLKSAMSELETLRAQLAALKGE